MAAQLGVHAGHKTLDHPDVAVEEARLHRANRCPTDDAWRLADVDPWQARRPLEERVRGNLDAGADGSTQILPSRADRIEGRRRPEVHNDHRAVVAATEPFPGPNAVDDPVRADFGRILVQDRHARRDAWLDRQR